jgi:hypothetical protein
MPTCKKSLFTLCTWFLKSDLSFYAGPLFSITDGKMNANLYDFSCLVVNTHLLIIAGLGPFRRNNLKWIVSRNGVGLCKHLWTGLGRSRF